MAAAAGAAVSAKLVVAALYEGKTRLLTRSAERTERAVTTQDAKTWTAKATLPGGVSGSSVGVCARLLLELAEPVRPTSVTVKNHGSAFVQLRVATAAQLKALKDVDAAGALDGGIGGGGGDDDDGERVFGSWPVLVPWTQLCSYDQLVRSIPNKFNKVRQFKGFSRFLTAGYKGLLLECAPFLDRKQAADDLVGLQWCCLYGVPYKGDGTEPPLASASQPLPMSQSLTPSLSPPAASPYFARPSPAPAAASASASASTAAAAASKPAPAAASNGSGGRTDAIAVSDDSGNSFSRADSDTPPLPPPKPTPTPSPPPTTRAATVLSVAAAAAAGAPSASPVPLCSGHGKAAVRRVIRKPDSKDFERSYYLCAQTPACDYKHWADGKPYSLDAGPQPAAAAAGAKRTRDAAASPTPAPADAAAASAASPTKKAKATA